MRQSACVSPFQVNCIVQSFIQMDQTSKGEDDTQQGDDYKRPDDVKMTKERTPKRAERQRKPNNGHAAAAQANA